MLDRHVRGRIARRIGVLTGAALVASLAASSVPALAAPVRPGLYTDREGEASGLLIFAKRCTLSTGTQAPRCSRKKKVRVMSAAKDSRTEEHQCRPPEGYGGQSSPPEFGGLYFEGARIARNRTFKSTLRDVRRVTHKNYDEYGNPDGTSWTTEETVVSRIKGRFGGRTVEGTYEQSREVKLVDGAPRSSSFPALGTCTTGVVPYAASLRRA